MFSYVQRSEKSDVKGTGKAAQRCGATAFSNISPIMFPENIPQILTFGRLFDS
jgi:ABC-type methionine transport system permease subunit